MLLHKEGRGPLISFAIILIGINAFIALFGGAFSLVSVILSALFYLGVLNFFRYEPRKHSTGDQEIVCPADGRVVVVEETEETELLGCRCLQVSVFMSVWNVHANWYPVGGRVVYTRYHKGKFLVAWLPKSSTENERSTVVVERPDGKAVLLRQIAGAVARRIVTYSKPEDAVRQGQELGFIKFGSRVDVFLPLGAEVLVHIGDAVVGTQTPLARM